VFLLAGQRILPGGCGFKELCPFDHRIEYLDGYDPFPCTGFYPPFANDPSLL
jgi:hypothetical protein